MLVSVLFFDEQVGGYGGKEYTYASDLPLLPFAKVFCPTYKGDKRAVVTKTNLPESSVKDEWRDRLKKITRYDNDKGNYGSNQDH